MRVALTDESDWLSGLRAGGVAQKDWGPCMRNVCQLRCGALARPEWMTTLGAVTSEVVGRRTTGTSSSGPLRSGDRGAASSGAIIGKSRTRTEAWKDGREKTEDGRRRLPPPCQDRVSTATERSPGLGTGRSKPSDSPAARRAPREPLLGQERAQLHAEHQQREPPHRPEHQPDHHQSMARRDACGEQRGDLREVRERRGEPALAPSTKSASR